MCGVAGILCRNGTPMPSPDCLQRMIRSLKHRGPDANGSIVCDNVALGHTRLKIVDLSDRAAQPMISDDGRYSLVYNGEIYNHLALREELVAQGCAFRSESDTEVLLKSFETWGVACLQRLCGMFAFAIWDKTSQVLYLARDRVGEKPLVYADLDSRLIFASEIESVLASGLVDRALDFCGIHVGLVYRDAIPAPYTAYKAIRKLPPGCLLTVDHGGAKVTKWWRPDFSRKRSLSIEEEAHDLRMLIRAVMKDCLKSDVPVGVLFSGGVDSSVCAVELSELQTGIDAFTLVSRSGGSESLEGERARAIGKALGLQQHFAEFSSDHIEQLPDILRRFGEPFGCGTMLYADPFFRFVREHVVVGVGGNGADEVFGGYSYFARSQRFRGIKRALERFGSAFPAMAHVLAKVSKKARCFLSREDLIAAGVREYSSFVINCLAGPALVREVGVVDAGWPIVECVREVNSDEVLDAEQFASLKLMTQHTFGALPDILGMRHSLEVRSPFLDHRLLDFSFGLPARHRIPRPFDPRYNKGVLKKAYEGAIPSETLYGAKYGFGYGISFADLLRTHWRTLFERLCLDGESVSAGLISPEKLRALWGGHLQSKGDTPIGEMMWDVLVLEIWLRAVCMNVSLDLRSYLS